MSPPRATALAIAAAIVVGLVLRLGWWTAAIGSDDLTHAWAATHLGGDPIEHGMPDGPDSAYTVNARRLGVNLPLAAAAAIAGPSETTFAAATLVESLLGILACALLAGALAGRRAAVVAAALAAVTPIEVWQATIFLQDTLWSAGLAATLAALAHAGRHDRRWAWIAAGLGLGYLQYVKESAAVLVLALVVLGAVRSWRARRIDRGTLWLLAGVALVQVAVALYWWRAVGDPGYYVRAWLGRQTAVEEQAVARPFPHNLVRLGLYLGYHQALGLGLLFAAGLGVRWLRRGDAPARVRQDLAVIAALQLALLLHVLRWGAWTQRYLLQLTPIVIAVGAAGLATAWPHARMRTRQLAVAAVIATTALGLLLGRPQHGRFRVDVVRAAAVAIERTLPADAPVYVVLGPRPAHYTDRVLALLDRYRHPRWSVIADPAMITRGVIVYAHLERHPTRPVAPPGRQVFVATEPGGKQWIEVYAVGL